jgi:hypothetical protein
MNLDMEAGDGIREQQHGIIFYGSCLTVFFFTECRVIPFLCREDSGMDPLSKVNRPIS